MNKKIFAFAMVLAIFAGCTGTQAEPDIKVSYPKVTHSAMTENAISAFMFIENKGSADDYLVSARIKELPDKRVEVHDVVDGKMVHIEKIKIPAGAVVELKMGSYHVMGFDITEHVDEITLVLNFGKSGEIEVVATVPEKEETTAEGMDMGGM
ncbi:copper chaperone PCu(A)C [archaeon]|nr:copper chaperone PCu(A)C [archaeon]